MKDRNIQKKIIIHTLKSQTEDIERLMEKFDNIMLVINTDIELRKAFDAFSNPLFFLIDKEGILLAQKISSNTLKSL